MSDSKDLVPQANGSVPKRWPWLSAAKSKVGATLSPSETRTKVGIAISTAGAVLGGTVLILETPIESGQGTTIGGLAVLGGAALTYYNAKRTREVTHDDEEKKLTEQQEARDQLHNREVRRDLQSRFTTSASQLADNSATIRLAGVYSLASLADDWAASGEDAERQVCIDLLCAYLRTPPVIVTQSAPSVAMSMQSSTADDLREAEVRNTIVRIIRQRTLMDPETESDGPWQNCKFDLSGAQLPHIGWSYCRFNGRIDFANATFQGGADFSHTHFNNVDFARAEFKGNPNTTVAIFKRTRFTRATFNEAKFFTNARFVGMIVAGSCDFTLVEFRGRQTDFAQANYEKGSRTEFNAATFTGRVSFANSWWRAPVYFRQVDFENTTRLDFASPRKWTVPPTVDWNEHGGWPSAFRGTWPPMLSKDIQAAAEQEAASEHSNDTPESDVADHDDENMEK